MKYTSSFKRYGMLSLRFVFSRSDKPEHVDRKNKVEALIAKIQDFLWENCTDGAFAHGNSSVLNLYESGLERSTIFDEVWFDPYSGLIFRKDTGRELFVGRTMEYVARQSWSKWRLVEALGHKPRLMIEPHKRYKWIVKFKGRIVAKSFQSYEEAMGWIEANSHAF